MKTLHLQLEDETHKRLKQLAAQQDMTMKELIVFLLPFDEASEIDPKQLETVKVPVGLVQSTPAKNNSEGKPSNPRSYCAEHLVSKSICKLMKHKA